MEEERAPNKSLAKLIACFCAPVLFLAILPNDGKEAAVTAAITEEVTERACIAQYGPGDRFNKPMKCALGTRDVDASALSYPIARSK